MQAPGNMLISFLQLNPTIGAIEANAKKLLSFALEAKSQQAAILIAPELALSGYPPKDILYRQDFYDRLKKTLEFIAKAAPLPIILGAPLQEGKQVHNAAVLFDKGQWQVVGKKGLLPTYDVFDERRYFTPAETFASHEIEGKKMAFLICEDIWNDEDSPVSSKGCYDKNPVSLLSQTSPDLYVVIAASPFVEGKPELRERLLKHLAFKYKAPFVMVGQVGANDQLIFDGHSLVVDEKGNIKMRGPLFKEALVFCELLAPSPSSYISDLPHQMTQLQEALQLGIRDYVEKCGAKSVVLGLSGGIDSSVVAVLAVQALGADRVVGVRMPSQYTSDHSMENAEELARNLAIQLYTVPIEPAVNQLRQAVQAFVPVQTPLSADIADQNLQARTRCIILMDYANRTGAYVLGTSNKSELAVGYGTLYGDLAGALAPLGDLYKTKVYKLARHLNKNGDGPIPLNCLQKAPSAELKPDQKDQDNLPPYEFLDKVLQLYIEENESIELISEKLGVPQEVVKKVAQMVQLAEYKRKQAPPALSVSEKVFGESRRWPVAKKYL